MNISNSEKNLKSSEETKVSAKFKLDFITQFCANWCAINYRDFCSRGLHDELDRPPIEDAEFLAESTWEEVMKNGKKTRNLINLLDNKVEDILTKETLLIVNGREFKGIKKEYSYDDIVTLAGKTGKNWTITYYWNGFNNSIPPNQTVYIGGTEKVVFNVYNTSNA